MVENICENLSTELKMELKYDQVVYGSSRLKIDYDKNMNPIKFTRLKPIIGNNIDKR
jgi:hypothetical protein